MVNSNDVTGYILNIHESVIDKNCTWSLHTDSMYLFDKKHSHKTIYF